MAWAKIKFTVYNHISAPFDKPRKRDLLCKATSYRSSKRQIASTVLVRLRKSTSYTKPIPVVPRSDVCTGGRWAHYLLEASMAWVRFPLNMRNETTLLHRNQLGRYVILSRRVLNGTVAKQAVSFVAAISDLTAAQLSCYNGLITRFWEPFEVSRTVVSMTTGDGAYVVDPWEAQNAQNAKIMEIVAGCPWDDRATAERAESVREAESTRMTNQD